MGANVFRDMMEKNYHEIKTLFKKASKAHHFVFSEDTFSEAYIKCYKALQKKTNEMDEKEVLRYFWLAFVNNTRKGYRKTKYSIDITELLESDEDIPDSVYDETKFKAVDILIEHVKQEFTEDEFKAWYLHFAENKSYEDLKEMGYNFNFHNVFRNINNYVRNKLPKENLEFNNILKDLLKQK